MPSSRRNDTAQDPARGTGDGVADERPDGATDVASDSAAGELAPGTQDRTRQRVIDATAALLADGGADAVTTRAVAAAAGVQAPTIYRLFGDKEGLLDAVAEHGYAQFLAAKHDAPRPDDPLEDLRTGWDLAVEFGLTNPALYPLMYGEPRRGTDTPAFEAGMQMLRARIQRLAAAGWLRLDPALAALVIHATARGAVLTWLSLPEVQRDPALLRTLREAMVTAVTTAKPAVAEPGAAGAARALRAELPEQTALRPAEAQLLDDWLGRLTAAAD